MVKPGSWNITQEPFSISVRRRATVGLWVSTLTSEPARMLVSAVRVNDLPLRLTTIGGWGGPEGPRAPATRAAMPPGPAPGRGALAGAGLATAMRPISPLHTAAFQVGFTWQASSMAMASFSSLMRMKESGTPSTEPSRSWNTAVL